MEQWVALLPRTKKVHHQAEAFLCGVYIFSLCLFGFLPQCTDMHKIKLTRKSKLIIGVNASVNSCGLSVLVL